MARGLRGRRRRRPARRRGSACPTTRRWLATAPTGPTGASAWRSSTSSDALRGSDFKVFESVLGAGGVVRGDQRRQARDVALGARRAQRGRPAPRRQGRRVGDRRGGRRVALADREVPRRGAHRGGRRRCWARRRATCCCSSPTQRDVAAGALGGLRLELGRRFGLIPEGAHDVHWVVDFPMFERTRGGAGRRCTTRSPRRRAPSRIRARCARARYDLIMDGSELGGGSIRINTPEVQREVFEVIGMSEEEADSRFGFLLEALRYGAPPHGGIAFGIDRVVAVLARPRVDPRRHRVPEDGQRAGPADRRAGAGRRPPAPRARAAPALRPPPVGADLEITGALLVTPDGERRGTLVVEDGRIAGIAERPPGRRTADDRRRRPRGAAGDGRRPRALHGARADGARGLRPRLRRRGRRPASRASPSTRTAGR